jgi:ubiquinone/menaquinone biosynthesis C-methylase UbiE
MPDSRSREHRQYFNGLAPQWNAMAPEFPRLRESLIRFGVVEGDQVLDVGAGTGKTSSELSNLVGEKGRVVSLDYAEHMLTEGKKIHGRRNMDFLCADACRLPIKDKAMDRILVFSAFPHFSEPLGAIREMARVLKPGGRILILHATSSGILNKFHASLQGPVSGDTLPIAGEATAMLERSGLRRRAVAERDDLYWVEAEKKQE